MYSCEFSEVSRNTFSTEHHQWLFLQGVEEVFPEGYRDCLNMDMEEIACGSNIETDSVSDDMTSEFDYFCWTWRFIIQWNV